MEDEGRVSPYLIIVYLYTFRIYRENFIIKVIKYVGVYREYGDSLKFNYFSIILTKGTSIFRAYNTRKFILY